MVSLKQKHDASRQKHVTVFPGTIKVIFTLKFYPHCSESRFVCITEHLTPESQAQGIFHAAGFGCFCLWSGFLSFHL